MEKMRCTTYFDQEDISILSYIIFIHASLKLKQNRIDEKKNTCGEKKRRTGSIIKLMKIGSVKHFIAH
jgi:hypothetical protein